MNNTTPQLVRLFPQLEDPTSALIAPQDISRVITAEERSPAGSRPWVYTNMVASLDGGTAVSGLSGALGSPADKAVFAGLRDDADIILVGASTVRAERYQVPNRSDEVSQSRRATGREAHPRLAVITASGNLPLDLPMFDDPTNQPLVFTTTEANADQIAALSECAEVVEVGGESVDLSTAVAYLGRLGAKTVLSEGGPQINGQLVSAGVVDEWNLTLSPHLLAGNSSRAAVGPLLEGPPQGMELTRVWADDHFLFCRWVRA